MAAAAEPDSYEHYAKVVAEAKIEQHQHWYGMHLVDVTKGVISDVLPPWLAGEVASPLGATAADALALMDGEKIRDIVTRPSSIENDLALGPSKEDAASRLFADLEPDVRDWAVERLTLHPRNVFYQPVKLPDFWRSTWTASVIYCTEAQNPGKRHQKRAADALGASWHEIETGHYPMLSTPDRLVKLILQG